MGRIIEVAQWVGGAPMIQTPQYDSAATFTKGALLLIDTDGEVIECSADPTLVDFVALQGAGTNPGYDAANSPATFTGRQQTVSAVRADATTVFSMRGKNGATDPETPALTNIGESYGVVKVSNDWVLDLTETTTKVFKVVDIDIDQKIFYCVFDPAALA